MAGSNSMDNTGNTGNTGNTDNRGLSERLLSIAAARAAERLHLLASVIKRYMAFTKLTEQELCARLECDQVTLNHLRLCGRPDADPEAFAIDVQRMADRFGISAGVLAAIIREADAAGAFETVERTTASPFSSMPVMPSMLLAARDREDVLDVPASSVEELEELEAVTGRADGEIVQIVEEPFEPVATQIAQSIPETRDTQEDNGEDGEDGEDGTTEGP